METDKGTTASNVGQEAATTQAMVEDAHRRQQQMANLQRVKASGSAEYHTQYDMVIMQHAVNLCEGACHMGQINQNAPEDVLVTRSDLIHFSVNKELMITLAQILDNKGVSTLEQKAKLLQQAVDAVKSILGLCANMGLAFDTAYEACHVLEMQKILGASQASGTPKQALFQLCLQAFNMAEKADKQKKEAAERHVAANEEALAAATQEGTGTTGALDATVAAVDTATAIADLAQSQKTEMESLILKPE